MLKMKRKLRLEKKLHKQYLMDVSSDIVMDREIENKLWRLKQGEKIVFNFENYHGSYFLSKYKLQYNVKRGPIDGFWSNQSYEPNELVLFFQSQEFPEICHSWVLYEEDKNI